MLSKLEKQAVLKRVEQDLVEVLTRGIDAGVRFRLVEKPSFSYLDILDGDFDNSLLGHVHNAMFIFTGSFGVLQLLFSCRKSDFIRDVCKRHGFELVEGGC